MSLVVDLDLVIDCRVSGFEKIGKLIGSERNPSNRTLDMKRPFFEEDRILLSFVGPSAREPEFELSIQLIDMNQLPGQNLQTPKVLITDLQYSGSRVEALGVDYFPEKNLMFGAYKISKKLSMGSHELMLGCWSWQDHTDKPPTKLVTYIPGKGLWVKDRDWNSKIHTRARFRMSSGRVFCLVTVSSTKLALFSAQSRQFTLQRVFDFKHCGRFTAPGWMQTHHFPCVIRGMDTPHRGKYRVYMVDIVSSGCPKFRY